MGPGLRPNGDYHQRLGLRPPRQRQDMQWREAGFADAAIAPAVPEPSTWGDDARGPRRWVGCPASQHRVDHMKRLFLSVGLMALASAAQAQLFTPNGAFQVQTNAAPGTGTDNASLTIGTAQALLNAGSALRVFTAPGSDLPGAEWGWPSLPGGARSSSIQDVNV
jgi:hypothetical protein